MSVRLALVGCGYWGPKVIRAAASLPDVEVAALVDFREDLRETLRRHYPLARTTASLSEALAGGPIDAVIVATNPSTHVEVAAEAIEAGCHVMVEKPLALSAADCRALGEQARAAGLVLMAGHTFRFSPLVNHVHALLESQELGEVY
jgi:predicted dehydrogenase